MRYVRIQRVIRICNKVSYVRLERKDLIFVLKDGILFRKRVTFLLELFIGLEVITENCQM